MKKYNLIIALAIFVMFTIIGVTKITQAYAIMPEYKTEKVENNLYKTTQGIANYLMEHGI